MTHTSTTCLFTISSPNSSYSNQCSLIKKWHADSAPFQKVIKQVRSVNYLLFLYLYLKLLIGKTYDLF